MKKEKKKEKKKYGAGRIVLCCVIAFIIGAVGMCGVFYVLRNHSDIDWQTYIEHTLIPNAIAIVAAIGTALLTLKPIITNIASVVTSVVDKFKSATEDVNATVTSSAKSEAEVYESRREIAELRAEIEEIRECAKLIPEALAVINETRTELINNTEISKLGFGSMGELVKKGSARRIMEYKTAKVTESEVNADEGSDEDEG